MEILGLKNKWHEVGNGFKVKNPELTHKPDGFIKQVKENGEIVEAENLVKIPKQKIAKALAKNYQYIEVKIGKNESLKETELKLNSMDLHGLHIIINGKNQVLSYVFKDRQDNFNRNNWTNQIKQIKAGHKRYNASKDFKMRQANGNKKVQAFKLYSMNWQG